MFNDPQVQAALKNVPDPQLMQMGQNPIAPTTPMDIQSEIARRSQLRAGVQAAGQAPPNPMGAQPIGQVPATSPGDQGVAALPADNVQMKSGGIVPHEFPTDIAGWHKALTGEIARRKKLAEGGIARFAKGGSSDDSEAGDDDSIKGGRAWTSGGPRKRALLPLNAGIVAAPVAASAATSAAPVIPPVSLDQYPGITSLWNKFLAVRNAPVVPWGAPSSIANDPQASASTGQPTPAPISIPPTLAATAPTVTRSGIAAIPMSDEDDVLDGVPDPGVAATPAAASDPQADKLKRITDAAALYDKLAGPSHAARYEKLIDDMKSSQSDPVSQGIMALFQGPQYDPNGHVVPFMGTIGNSVKAAISKGQAQQAENEAENVKLTAEQLRAAQIEDAANRAKAGFALSEEGQNTRAETAAQMQANQMQMQIIKERMGIHRDDTRFNGILAALVGKQGQGDEKILGTFLDHSAAQFDKNPMNTLAKPEDRQAAIFGGAMNMYNQWRTGLGKAPAPGGITGGTSVIKPGSIVREESKG